MSNENDFAASLNRLEMLIDSNQAELKRDVESIITESDRRYGSLKEELNRLKSSHYSLGQITDLLALLAEEDNQRNLSDLPDRIRAILSTITSNNHVQTMDSSETGGNGTVASVDIPDELGTGGHVNGLEINVTSTGTHLSQSISENKQVNSDSFDSALSSVSTANERQQTIAIEHDQTTDEDEYHQIDLPEGGEELSDNQNELLPEDSNETNHDISASVSASPSDIPVIIKVEDSSSPQSVRVCKRWIAELDGEDLWYCDCGSDECRVKQEIKDEFVETGEFEIENNDMFVQLGTQVKEEVESGEENVIGPEDGDELNVNQNESLHEESNGTNQCSVNGNPIDNEQVDNGGHELAIDECNQSQTSKQSKTRKRKRTGKSLATENETLENSLPSTEVSTPKQRSKRIRVTSPLETETTEQLCAGSGFDLSNGDNRNGIDSSGEGEKGVEQSEDDDDETELGEEDQGRHNKIEIIKLKCTEDGCEDEVASRDELNDHLRIIHRISPYRCLAVGCNERFEQWNELGLHVRDNHSNISTWPCPYCTKTFKTHNRLYMHLHQYHFEGQFKCGYDGCHYDRVATLRSEIKNHQRSVHSKTIFTIFTCQYNNCGKSFNHKGHFNCHQRIHQGVNPFKCTWNMCNYASIHQSAVIKHIRTQHFHLPKSQKEQRQRGIVDNRNPRDYLLGN